MNLNRDIEEYILANIDQEDPVLQELNRETHLKLVQPRMISGHLQGLVLKMFSKMIRPRNILEIGTFTGYSAICLVEGLMEGGMLYTIEIDDELKSFATRYFKKAGITDKVTQLIGPALEIIPELKQAFDLVFIDAEKTEYCKYYGLVFDKVSSGGFIIADNTLWSGKVIQKDEKADAFTLGILRFNEMVQSDSRIEKVILPVRDGMTIIRKK